MHLCADTGSDSWPYRKAGYEVVLVGSNVGVEHFSAVGEKYHGVIANPPCTEFSIARSGGKPRLGDEGLYLVRHCQRIIAEARPDWWVIENPATGALKQYLGVPNYQYQPWWYGSPWTKLTALWGNFNIPERKYWRWEDVPKINGLYVRGESKHRRSTGKPAMYQMHKSAYDVIPEFHCLPRPQNDMEFRSLCSQQFAQAFYEVNNLNTIKALQNKKVV